MLDLLPADVGAGGIRANQKEKIIRPFNAFLDLSPPIYGRLDPLLVDPEFQILIMEGFGQFTGGFSILARIGNK